MSAPRRVLLTLTGMVGMMLATAAVAWACSPNAYITLSASQGPAGDEITVEGKAFEDGPVRVYWEPNGELLHETSGPDFEVPVTIPEDADEGVGLITAYGFTDSVEDDPSGYDPSAFTVTGPPVESADPEPGDEPIDEEEADEPTGEDEADEPSDSEETDEPSGEPEEPSDGEDQADEPVAEDEPSEAPTEDDGVQLSPGEVGQQADAGEVGEPATPEDQQPTQGEAPEQPAGEADEPEQPDEPAVQEPQAGDEPQPAESAQPAQPSASEADQPAPDDSEEPGEAAAEEPAEPQAAMRDASWLQGSVYPDRPAATTGADAAAVSTTSGDLWSGLERAEESMPELAGASATSSGSDQTLLAVGAAGLAAGLLLLAGGALALTSRRPALRLRPRGDA